MASVCGLTEDSWLSKTLDRAVYRLSPRERLLHGNKDDGFLDVLRHGPVFAYAKVATTDIDAVHFLESLGFGLVDTAIVLEKPLDRPVSELDGVRFARSEDRSPVGGVARRSFEFSRFHLDPRIPSDLANRVKEAWVESYFAGTRGDGMVVREAGGTVTSFLAILLDEARRAVTIDLIAVDPLQRGRGYASDMIGFVETRFAGLSCIRVGTQMANVPSLRMYGKLGFQIAESSYVFHYHR